MTVPELRTVDELGAELWPTWDSKKRRRWIYRQVEERGMPAIRLGRQIVFETTAVADWLASQGTGTTPTEEQQTPCTTQQKKRATPSPTQPLIPIEVTEV